jgi:hypothetical protein
MLFDYYWHVFSRLKLFAAQLLNWVLNRGHFQIHLIFTATKLHCYLILPFCWKRFLGVHMVYKVSNHT